MVRPLPSSNRYVTPSVPYPAHATLVTGQYPRAINECDADLVPLMGPEFDRLISEHEEYRRTSIPKQTYMSLKKDVSTFAVEATIVTLSTMDDDTVYAFVRNTLASVDSLRKTTPVLERLNINDMRTKGFTVPMHPAAARAFENFSIKK